MLWPIVTVARETNLGGLSQNKDPLVLKPDRTDAFRSFNTQCPACRFQNTVHTHYTSVLPKLETE